MQDPVVPVKLALQSRDLLTALDYDVSWQSYPMPHAVCPEEISDIRDWIRKICSPEKVRPGTGREAGLGHEA
jgi:phospholipase/carboxylesterase